MLKEKTPTDSSISKKDVEDDPPSIEEQLRGINVWRRLGEVRPGEEFARLKWIYGKGKRKMNWTIILKKSENPVPMEEIAKEFARIIAPGFYEYLEKNKQRDATKFLEDSAVNIKERSKTKMSTIDETIKYRKEKKEFDKKARKILVTKSIKELSELKAFWTGVYKENNKMDEHIFSKRLEAAGWIENIDKMLHEKATHGGSGSIEVTSIDKKYMNIEEACALLKMPKSTLYKRTADKKIPHIKEGKTLLFVREELENFLTASRVITAEEVDAKAATAVADLALKRKRKVKN